MTISVLTKERIPAGFLFTLTWMGKLYLWRFPKCKTLHSERQIQKVHEWKIERRDLNISIVSKNWCFFSVGDSVMNLYKTRSEDAFPHIFCFNMKARVTDSQRQQDYRGYMTTIVIKMNVWQRAPLRQSKLYTIFLTLEKSLKPNLPSFPSMFPPLIFYLLLTNSFFMAWQYILPKN